MHSPIDRASPTLSESSSDSPEQEIEEASRAVTIEEISFAPTQPGPSNNSFGASAPKRRLPGGGMMFGSGGARDPKTRRKDVRAGGVGVWDIGPGMARSMRDDLVDTQVVEHLRNLFGDPFDETLLKYASAGS